jgi:hypothetical protein
MWEPGMAACVLWDESLVGSRGRVGDGGEIGWWTDAEIRPTVRGWLMDGCGDLSYGWGWLVDGFGDPSYGAGWLVDGCGDPSYTMGV